PPYSMISYPLHGTPQTTYLGDDLSKLSWKNTQPPDTRFLLQLVDGSGAAGGVGTLIFKNDSGQCSPPSEVHPPFTATSNVTTDKLLDNCEPWAVTIAGGSPPYSLSFVQPDGNVITNVTLPAEDNTYTFVNSSLPGTVLLGAILLLSFDIVNFVANFTFSVHRVAAVSDA
ncbi:hypothetical protein BJ165DRAFT_1358064, partial [Panaeolus papilionaceus]